MSFQTRSQRKSSQLVKSQNKKAASLLQLTACFYDGRSDWIRTSDPLLPKQVRYHAAPRSVMGCFVRKRPCFGKGGPSGGQGRCLP